MELWAGWSCEIVDLGREANAQEKEKGGDKTMQTILWSNMYQRQCESITAFVLGCR